MTTQMRERRGGEGPTSGVSMQRNHPQTAADRAQGLFPSVPLPLNGIPTHHRTHWPSLKQTFVCGGGVVQAPPPALHDTHASTNQRSNKRTLPKRRQQASPPPSVRMPHPNSRKNTVLTNTHEKKESFVPKNTHRNQPRQNTQKTRRAVTKHIRKHTDTQTHQLSHWNRCRSRSKCRCRSRCRSRGACSCCHCLAAKIADGKRT
jgi:hypothetical protein